MKPLFANTFKNFFLSLPFLISFNAYSIDSAQLSDISEQSGSSLLETDVILSEEMDRINTAIHAVRTNPDLLETDKLFRLHMMMSQYAAISQARTAVINTHNKVLAAQMTIGSGPE
ncbi:hypothetical protein [Microbulbifer discodermiae]|uniref:hypothetical protein n=1 Tax=Microbulbifer sp. 2201CG32-9 TaxID=3232309 RepID=UPI00345B5AD6